MSMKVLGIFRGFPGLGRVVSGVSLLETLRDKYNCDIEIISYLQGNRYLESRGYKGLREAIPMDYCSIGLLPTNKMGVHINDRIKTFEPDLIIVDGEPLILHSLKISHPQLKIATLLNPADVDNPHNDKEAMEYFNTLYSMADLAIVHGLRTATPILPYKNIISTGTILREEILKTNNTPSKVIYCLLGGGTVNVSHQFAESTIRIASLCMDVAERFPDWTMNIVCSSQNIYDAINENKCPSNVVIYNQVLDAQQYYSDAGLIITRSGRNTLSELAYLGIPAISFVTGDSYRKTEQIENIRSLNVNNIRSVSIDISVDEFGVVMGELIKVGKQKNEFKYGNEECINSILGL